MSPRYKGRAMRPGLSNFLNAAGGDVLGSGDPELPAYRDYPTNYQRDMMRWHTVETRIVLNLLRVAGVVWALWYVVHP